MNSLRQPLHTILFFILLAAGPRLHGAPPLQAPPPLVPPIIDEGFRLWTTRGVGSAFDAWQRGGLLDGDSKTVVQVNYFRRLDREIGGYQSYEPVDVKPIGQSSKLLFIAMNFDHAVVYARFLLYHTGKAWVVQSMDFSPKPEAIMPWLAFGGVSYNE